MFDNVALQAGALFARVLELIEKARVNGTQRDKVKVGQCTSEHRSKTRVSIGLDCQYPRDVVEFNFGVVD